MAVGDLVNAEREELPLAERWTGRRLSVLVTPNPPLGGGGFDGVSCPSMTFCAATGAQGSSQGILTFTEVWQAGKWQVVPSPSP
jgi:hypothetical protein